MPLTGNQRRHLRGLAHHKDAVVQVGHQGVTEALLAALDQALTDHELVKVRLAQAVEDRESAADELASGTKSECVQQMGRTVVLYRKHPKKPKIELPKPRKPAAKAPAAKAPAAKAPVDDDDEDAAPAASDDDE